MLLIRDKDEMRSWARARRLEGLTVSLVPTMGSLHRGHLNLVQIAKKTCDVVVVSIYVNPTQFAAHEDFDVYPRDAAGDHRALNEAGVDAVFEPMELYRSHINESLVVGVNSDFEAGQHDTYVVPQHMQKILCGRSRPHFFRGVATVVAKLFNIVGPDVAVFGKKDYQQWRIICAMVEDLDYDIDVLGAEVSREEDGLACSSRNIRLTESARTKAPVIHSALQWAVEQQQAGRRDPDELAKHVRDMIEEGGGRVDYVEVVHAATLGAVNDVIEQPAVLAVAAFFPGRDGTDVRLIDNMLLE